MTWLENKLLENSEFQFFEEHWILGKTSKLPDRMDIYSVSSAFKICFILLMVVAVSHAQIRNIKLSTTEYQITLTFTPNPSATNYSVSFRLSQGFFYHDYLLSPPYDNNSLTVSHDSALPGTRYTVDVFENGTEKVWEGENATVPLQPQDLTDVDRGSSYLLLDWFSLNNLTYDRHQITYKRENGSWEEINGTVTTSFNLTGLDPGYKYEIYVEAITAGVRSRKSDTLFASTLPLPPIQLTAMAEKPHKIRVTWQPAANSFQDSYEVQFSLDGSVQLQNSTCSQSPCLISPGPPKGQVIHIFVRSVSYGYRSSPASTEGSTAPGEITSLDAEEGVGSLQLSWMAPVSSIQTSYLLTLQDMFSNIHNWTIPANTSKITYAVDLFGGYRYEVQVKAISKYAVGSPVFRSFMTFPEPVSNLTGQAINTTALAISWINPAGSQISFINMTLSLQDGSRGRVIEIDDASMTKYTVTDLVPGQEYQVSLFVHSVYTPSMPSEGVMATFSTKPVKPKVLSVQIQERQMVVTLVREAELGVFDSIQASLVELVLPPQMTDANGTLTFRDLEPGTEYTLKAFTLSRGEKSDMVFVPLFTKPLPPESLAVVAEDSDTIYASWVAPANDGYDNFSVIIAEVDSIAHPKMIMTVELFAEFHGLQAGTTYNVSVSAVKSDQYSQEIWDLNTTTKKPTSNGGLVGGVVSAVIVVVIIVIVVVVVMRRQRRRPKPATKHKGAVSQFEQSSMNKFSRPVKLSDFPTHVRKMSADSDFKYAEEYEDLKEVGRDQPCLAAEFPPNRPKNRFTNILPYDHSRVKLLPTDDEEGSDYINANYMPGYNSKREYIATQGPLPATRDDFWRMVWEQSSRNIVMLTRCQEKGREKSDHYWPSDSEPVFYGDLHVVILNETHMPDWTVTEFKVSLGDQSRNVRHFHYRVWPDFGVPKDPTSLIRFVRTVREKLIREGGPIITHCSAGVGRSGTFIVLDHLLQLIREKDEVDVFNIVYKLRKERVLMVQTEQQYKFIHECLVCVLEGREEDTTYANVGQVNVGFEDESSLTWRDDDDEGINVENS